MPDMPIFHFPCVLSSWGSVTAPVAWPCGYINMPLPQLKFSEGLTISAWARLLTPNPWSTIFSLETPTVERSILWVGVEKDSKTLRVDIPGDVGGGGFIKSPFTGYDPQFAHVALVWDPENAQTRLYLNGAQAAVGVIADDAFNITNRLTDITLVIGPSKYDGHRVNSWDGQIGEVRVYDRALSNANVKTLFRTTGPRGSSQTAWNGGDA